MLRVLTNVQLLSGQLPLTTTPLTKEPVLLLAPLRLPHNDASRGACSALASRVVRMSHALLDGGVIVN